MRGAVVLVLATLLTLPAAAQEGGTLPAGPIYLTDTLTVEAGETLRIGPGTSLTGPGNITVWGALVVNGTPGAPAELSVPIRVLGNGSVDLRQARLWGVGSTALEVTNGSARLEQVLLEGNTRGAIVKGASRLSAEAVVFRDHAGEGLYVEERADVELTNATFSSNGRGATVYSATRFHATGGDFLANGQHVVVDLGPWSTASPDIAFDEVRFGAPAPTPARLPGILLRYDAPIVDDIAPRVVRLADNRIEGAAVGLRAEGQGLTVESVRDTYVDNVVGLSVQLATVRLDHATLGNTRDIEGSGRVTLEAVTYLGSSAQVAQPTAQPAGWAWWILGASALALLGALVLAPRLRRPRASPPADPPPPPARAAEPPALDVHAPLSAAERRILEDILAHPQTPQRAVADRLGYTRQALHYHVKKLEARGLVLKTVEGRETRCTVPPGVASMLSSSPVTRTGSQEKA